MNIKTLLKKEGLWLGAASESGGASSDYAIKCISGLHEDDNPSLNIDKHSGEFHCLSCGFGGSDIYAKLGKTAPIRETLEDELLAMLTDLETDIILEIPDGAVFREKPWRGIPVSILQQFSVYEAEDRMWFVIRDSFKKIKYFIGRSLDDDLEPKYMVEPKGVSKVLFPGVVRPYNGELILVEGITDLLKLNKLGYFNVISGNGLHIASKKTLSPFRNKGMTKLTIMYDGDLSGRSGAKKLKEELSGENYVVNIIDIEDEKDPMELSANSIRELLG